MIMMHAIEVGAKKMFSEKLNVNSTVPAKIAAVANKGYLNLKNNGWSVSAIAEQLDLDRKTVRKYLVESPQPYQRQNPAPAKIDPFRPFLRERWEQGVHNARKLCSLGPCTVHSCIESCAW